MTRMSSCLVLLTLLLPAPSTSVPVIDFNHPDMSTKSQNSLQTSSTFASLANILSAGSPLTYFKDGRPFPTHPASPALFDAHFTKLAPLYNTKAIIRADIILDFASARSFCSDILQGLPSFIHPVVAAYLSKIRTLPSAPLEHAMTIDPSSNLGQKLGRARKGSGPFRTPINKLLDFIYACHIREHYTMATLSTAALAKLNSTCRAWHMLDDSIVPNPSPHSAVSFDPLRDTRQANILQFHDPNNPSSDNIGDNKNRPKRGLLTGIALGATLSAAAAGGIWYASSGQHSDMLETHAKAINTLNDNTEAVVSALHAMNQRFIYERNYTRALATVHLLAAAADDLADTITDYSRAFAAAKSGKLTLGAINSNDLQSIFVQALQTAYSNKLFLPTAYPMDLLNMPAAAHSSGYTYTISISIPAADQQLSLFELTPTSILAEDASTDPMLIDIIPDSKYVATSNDSSLTAPVEDHFLDSCLRFRSSISCFTRLGLSQTPHSCIEHIFLRKRHETGILCDFQKHKGNWSAALAPDNVLHLATTTPISANITCSDANSTSSSAVAIHKGNNAVPLPPGCALISPNFTLPGLPYTLAVISITKQINFVLNTDILLGHSLQQLDQATNSFIQHGQEPPKSIKQALKQYQFLPSLPIDDAIGSTWTAILVLCLAMIIVIACLSCYIKHIRASSGRTKAFSKQAFTDIATLILGEEPGKAQYPRKRPRPAHKRRRLATRFAPFPRRASKSGPRPSAASFPDPITPVGSPATVARNRLFASRNVFSPRPSRATRSHAGNIYHAPDADAPTAIPYDEPTHEYLPVNVPHHQAPSNPEPLCTVSTANVLGTFSTSQPPPVIAPIRSTSNQQ